MTRWSTTSLTVAAVIGLAGCSSTHNLRTDGPNFFGGGFVDEEIRPGLYHLMAVANVSPWPSHSAAIATWRNRAAQLCGESAYEEIMGTVSDGPWGGGQWGASRFHYNTSISGYVICSSAGMGRSEATEYLKELRAKKAAELSSSLMKDLDELGGAACLPTDKKTPAEILYRRGRILTALNDYKSAMACFLVAQARGRGTAIYRDACRAIGTMYELGWGVKKDLPTAQSWYEKAGL